MPARYTTLEVIQSATLCEDPCGTEAKIKAEYLFILRVSEDILHVPAQVTMVTAGVKTVV